MSPKEYATKLICDKLLEEKEITQGEYENILQKYSKNDSVSLNVKHQEETTISNDVNNILIECGIDLNTIFKTLNDTDVSIRKYNNLNQSVINSVKLSSNKINDELHVIENKIRKGNLYTYFETFRDKLAIEDDESKYINVGVEYDSLMEALRLKPNSSINTLLSKTGNRMAELNVLDKYASMFTTYRNNYNLPNSAIDNSMETYWHECLEVNDPIQINYKTNVTDINNGAICELLIVMSSLTEINEINITPFCEFPIEIVEISYSTNDNDNYDDFIPLIFNINNGPNNKYMINKSSLNTIMYQFESIMVKRIKIVLNQIHYAVNHFIDDSMNALINGVYIKEDNTELINRIMDPINDAIINETFKVNLGRKINNINKLQYEYGLYNIAIKNNEYYSKSEFISDKYYFPGLSSVVLDTNEEHYEIGLYDPTIITSIEYELIVENGDEEFIYKILPFRFDKVRYELLNPIQSAVDNKIYATTRFDMDLINRDIILHKDGEVVEYGYTTINENTLEFIEFDPLAKYTITYNVKDIEKVKEIKLPTFTERIELISVRIRALFKQNSRVYTEVTPILHDYIFYATKVPIPVGGYNDLIELKLIPQKSYTNVPWAIPIVKSGKPILLEIEILQDPLIISTTKKPNSNVLEPDEVIEVDEYIE